MYDLNLPDLKSWRKQFGISQKKLADAANVSLATLRQVEVGGNKPHRKTLRKVRQAIDAIEKRPQYRKTVGSGVSASPTGVKRGRPPKTDTIVDSHTPGRRGRPPKSETARRNVQSARVTSGSTEVFQLNNIDLELINRVLSLDMKDKLALLDQLIG